MEDAHLGTTFYMCAALLRTVNDFSAYEMLSGWNIKGLIVYLYCQE